MADLTVFQLEEGARNAYKSGNIDTARSLLNRATALKEMQAKERGPLKEMGYAGGAGAIRGGSSAIDFFGQAPEMLNQLLMGGGSKMMSALGFGGGTQPEEQRKALEAVFAANPATAGMTREEIAAQDANAPTVADVARDVTGGYSEYQSPTTLGQYGGTIGEFAGGSAAMPIGGVFKSVLGSTLPAIGSETAGQLTKGTEYEGIARLAGALGIPIAQALTLPALRRLAIGPAEDVMQNVQGSTIRQSADLLQSKGVDLKAGQIMGSPQVNRLQNTMEPSLSQKVQLTRAALKEAGIADDVLATPNVLGDAKRRIGAIFDQADAVASTAPTNAEAAAAITALNRAEDAATMTKVSSGLKNISDDILSASGTQKVLSAKDINATRKKLSGYLTTYAKQNDQVNYELAHDLLDVLDDMVTRQIASTSPDLLQALNGARQQYRSFLTIERAVNRSGTDAARGIITPNALSSSVRTREGTAMVRGVGTGLSDLAHAAQEVLTPAPTTLAGGVRLSGGNVSGILDRGRALAAATQGQSLARRGGDVLTERLLTRLAKQTGGLLNID